MRRTTSLLLLGCTLLAGCEKPQLITYPGDPAQSVAPNSAPQVSVGGDLTVQWPANSTQLNATATDDGQPKPLTYTWTASPAGVQFDAANAAQTSAQFAAPGIYTLRLMVDDGALQAFDELIVTVTDVAPNTAPVVNAGADITIDFPRPAKLLGTATDDGLPGSALTTTWSKLSGPGDVTFTSASTLATAAKFSAQGTYELQLSASDGELTSNDVVVVIVGPPVYPAADTNADANHGWTRIVPAEVDLDIAALNEAQAYALTAGGAGIISRYGRIVHSWGDIDLRYDVKSTTKSIGGTALAFALDDRRVRLDDRAVTHIPEIETRPIENASNGAGSITLLQLATHTAGFEKVGGFGQIVDPPGTTWRYSDGGLNWLADALTSNYTQDLNALFASRLYPVIGITKMSDAGPGAGTGNDIFWRRNAFRRDTDGDGDPAPRPIPGLEYREFASGLFINVNAMSRIGLLYLRRGEWSGGQRVFDPSFVDLVRTPVAQNAALPSADPVNPPESSARFGVLWWTNATGALPNVPRDAYWAWGLHDSLIVIIPSLDLVIARAGTPTPPNATQRTWGEDNGWNADYAVLAPFLDPIVRAVQQ